MSQIEANVCDEGVYNGLYSNHVLHLRNYLYYKCGDMTMAEDLAQESYVTLWQKCGEVLFSKAKSYLFTVGYRLMLDKIKNQKVALKFTKSQTETVNKEDPHYQLRTKEFQEKVESAISSLPEEQREIFLMNRIDKISYKKIAEALGVSETTVEKRMAKALHALRSQIEEFKKI